MFHNIIMNQIHRCKFISNRYRRKKSRPIRIGFFKAAITSSPAFAGSNTVIGVRRFKLYVNKKADPTGSAVK